MHSALVFQFWQVSLPAKNDHFRQWLSHMDEISFNATVKKKLSREELFLSMAFCLGFSPQDEPVECLGLTLNNCLYNWFPDGPACSKCAQENEDGHASSCEVRVPAAR